MCGGSRSHVIHKVRAHADERVIVHVHRVQYTPVRCIHTPRFSTACARSRKRTVHACCVHTARELTHAHCARTHTHTHAHTPARLGAVSGQQVMVLTGSGTCGG